MAYKESAYIKTVPQIVKFELLYQDKSDKVQVTSQSDKNDFVIKQGNDSIILEVADIDWLKTVLEDIESYKELYIKQNQPATNE